LTKDSESLINSHKPRTSYHLKLHLQAVSLAKDTVSSTQSLPKEQKASKLDKQKN